MSKKLLSAQSHVVHGYVGNRAATFPLQLRGWDVDALNTVQFLNHPAYGSFEGIAYPGEELLKIYKAMVEIADVEHSVVLTGYIANVQTVRTIVEIVRMARTKNPGLKWFLDPVLGDNGRFYVAEEILPTYKEILAHEDVFLVTPNRFELELLTGCKVTDLRSLASTVQSFLETFPKVKNLVVTSVELEEYPDDIVCAAATQGNITVSYFTVEKIPGTFYGTGDLFTALLADCYVSEEPKHTLPLNVLEAALNEVLSIMGKVLRLSYDMELKKLNNDAISKGLEVYKTGRKIKVNDLRLIQSKPFFLSHDKDFVVKHV